MTQSEVIFDLIIVNLWLFFVWREHLVYACVNDDVVVFDRLNHDLILLLILLNICKLYQYGIQHFFTPFVSRFLTRRIHSVFSSVCILTSFIIISFLFQGMHGTHNMALSVHNLGRIQLDAAVYAFESFDLGTKQNTLPFKLFKLTPSLLLDFFYHLVLLMIA